MVQRTESVMEQWVHCKFGGDFNVKSKWNRMYLVLNGKGALSLFEDETMDSVKGTFDLTLWTLQQFDETEKVPEFGAFTVSMESAEGDIQFVFETEGDRREMVNAMKPFIGDENGDSAERVKVGKSKGMQFAVQFQSDIQRMRSFLVSVCCLSLWTRFETAKWTLNEQLSGPLRTDRFSVKYWCSFEGERGCWTQSGCGHELCRHALTPCFCREERLTVLQTLSSKLVS